MIRIKRFYYAEHKGATLPVNEGLNLGPMPLIWSNDGLYGLIPKDKVANIISILEDFEKLPVVAQKKIGIIQWDEATILDPEIAKQLL